MRAARRPLVVCFAALLSLLAVPAYADDDSHGLLDTVGKTVNTLVAPKPSATPPAPAPQAPAPVKQLTKVVDSALGGKTSLSENPLVATADSLLGGQRLLAAPAEGANEVKAEPVVVARSSQVSGLAVVARPSQVSERAVVARPQNRTFSLIEIAATPQAGPARVLPVAAGHVPGTSTLPDGGSPLTLAWLLLCVGVTTAGAVVVRRART